MRASMSTPAGPLTLVILRALLLRGEPHVDVLRLAALGELEHGLFDHVGRVLEEEVPLGGDQAVDLEMPLNVGLPGAVAGLAARHADAVDGLAGVVVHDAARDADPVAGGRRRRGGWGAARGGEDHRDEQNDARREASLARVARVVHRFLLWYESIAAPLRGRGLRRLIPLADRVDRLLRGRLEEGVENVYGHRMILDRLDSLGIRSGPYEYFASQILIKRLVRPGWVVADVGAHIGYYTVLFADLVGPRGRVYAYEPDHANFALLYRNVRLNRYRNVFLERAAIADRERPLTLYLAHENVADHRVFDFYQDR